MASRGRQHISHLQRSCCLLLLFTLVSSSLCSLEVKVAQSLYQAEENTNVTLEWTFSNHGNLISLDIFCVFSSLEGEHRLYHVNAGAEVPQYQDAHFRGRVRSDPDAIREGRVSLHLSPLCHNDSGVYQCKIFSDVGRDSGVCHLNVTAPVHLKHWTPAEGSSALTRGRPGLYLGFSLLPVVGLAGYINMRHL